MKLFKPRFRHWILLAQLIPIWGLFLSIKILVHGGINLSNGMIWIGLARVVGAFILICINIWIADRNETLYKTTKRRDKEKEEIEEASKRILERARAAMEPNIGNIGISLPPRSEGPSVFRTEYMNVPYGSNPSDSVINMALERYRRDRDAEERERMLRNETYDRHIEAQRVLSEANLQRARMRLSDYIMTPADPNSISLTSIDPAPSNDRTIVTHKHTPSKEVLEAQKREKERQKYKELEEKQEKFPDPINNIDL